MARDPQIAAHLEWIGFVQPVGLVVSIPALLNAQAYINKNVAPVHQRFLASLEQDGNGEPVAKIADFRRFVCEVLEWQATDLVEVTDANCDKLEVLLPEYQERLRPTYVVPELRPKDGQSPWQMIIQVVNESAEFDEGAVESKHGWHASPQAKFERLLRETEIPVGLLVNSRQIRLVYAPRGESSGYITFSVADMMVVAGRPILAALYLLLSVDRLFLLQQASQRLPAILADSRKYQNTVSTALAEQVLAALFELLRGFQAANDLSNRVLLRDILKADPNQVYGGLLTVLMRLVFILYAEDRNLLSSSSIYSEFYSVSRLYERLREDAGQYPDTMDHRYGAWPQLLTLFRLIYFGGGHGDFNLPERKGHLFDPGDYSFLEGRIDSDPDAQPLVPQISDGVIFRVLNNLLILDGERLSYRTLDVEQIGSVYEAIMGFSLEVAEGTSIAVKAKKSSGAPAIVNLDELLSTKPADRNKRLLELSEQELSGTSSQALREAQTVDELLRALEKKVARHVTPYTVPAGSMILQPSDERRRSGSHYTPRILTEPIVKTALNPMIEGLGPHPSAEQILDLKVCDPAMGSGAFLVEAARQLGDELVKAWSYHRSTPVIPADEDEVLHARRMVAQRCIYGVDRNPMAVNLAKLSMWLATLAKNHPFTFLDHALRCGDSLVGLSKDQLLRFHWKRDGQRIIDEKRIEKRIERSASFRKDILAGAEATLYPVLQIKLADADSAIEEIRVIGDAIVSSFFSSTKDKQRVEARTELLSKVSGLLELTEAKNNLERQKESVERLGADLRQYFSSETRPFHWTIEFPEVFNRTNAGFDVIVGNPPFLGGTRISEVQGMPYFQWLVTMYPPCEHHCDLVAYFLRRAFTLLRQGGTFGLVTTNTVAQGDTREGGLRTILNEGGHIYSARRRYRWPGQAAVIVSVVHVSKQQKPRMVLLDGRSVRRISAYLVEGEIDESPARLACNPYFSLGSKIYGQGFLFADNDSECTPLAEARVILQNHPNYASRIRPYLVGEELNSRPEQLPKRLVINLSDVQTESELDQWPELKRIIEEKVKPGRLKLGDNPNNVPLKKKWWAYQAHRPELYSIIEAKHQVLCISRVGQALAFSFAPTNIIFSEAVVVFDLDNFASFAILQSRVHEVWARFFSSSLKDDLRYTPSDCFETFPFPSNHSDNEMLQRSGKCFYEKRSEVMRTLNCGLTELFNKFHNPEERSKEIVALRQLATKLDEVVCEAYGWRITVPDCEFLLDFDEDESDSDSQTRRRKPWRLRWPPEFRDEILARLLELNNQQFMSGQLSGKQKKQKVLRKPAKAKRYTGLRKASPEQLRAEEDTDKQLTFTALE